MAIQRINLGQKSVPRGKATTRALKEQQEESWKSRDQKPHIQDDPDTKSVRYFHNAKWKKKAWAKWGWAIVFYWPCLDDARDRVKRSNRERDVECLYRYTTSVPIFAEVFSVTDYQADKVIKALVKLNLFQWDGEDSFQHKRTYILGGMTMVGKRPVEWRTLSPNNQVLTKLWNEEK